MSDSLISRTYTLPAIWASYLINGDASGLTIQEQRQADDFLTLRKLEWPVNCGDVGFRWCNDAHDMGGSAALGQECAQYTFLVSSDWFTLATY